jgi:hypothetical protein
MSEPKVKVEAKTRIEFSDKAKKRLLRLAKLLRKDAKCKTGVKFNMGDWGSTEDENTKLGMNCGTQACALGLAAISGEFKREGLGFRNDIDFGDSKRVTTIEFTYKGRASNAIEAAVATFDIPECVADYIFGGDANVKTKGEGAKAEIEMAEIIENVAKGKLPQAIVEDLVFEYADN